MAGRRLSGRMAPVGALALSLLAAAGVAVADDRVKLDYAIQLGSVAMGKVELDQKPDGDGMRTQLEMKTGGGLLGFMQEETRTELEATSVRRDGQALPRDFHAVFKKPDRKREITIRYDDEGAIADFEFLNNGRDRDSDVPRESWAGTVDPLTALQRVQLWLAAEPEPGGEGLDIPVFDGRRRMDVQVRYLGPSDPQAGEGDGKISALEVLIVGRDGFDGDEQFVSFPDKGQERWLDVRFSTDATPVPLAAKVRTARPPVTVTLTDRD